MSFISELKRRNVIRMAGLYLVGAWLIAQIAETLLPIFHTPDWVLQSLVVLLAIGFIPALVFAWVFELTPAGLKRDEDVVPDQSIAPHTARRMERMIIALFAIALIFFAFDKFVLAPKRESNLVAEAVEEVKTAVSDKSIAVLPFVDMSPEGDQEYFSDGIAEELLNRLAQIPDLRVAARTSAFQFKGKNLDIADIGRQLNVAHVLEGSVRKNGSRLRITAQLINSASGFHMWSQTFEGDAGDVFKVQDEIAVAITDVLKSKLSVNAVKRKPAVIVNPKAYDSYLQGRAFIARRWLENLDKAIAAFDRAIEIDPSYSAAFSGRAFAYTLRPLYDGGGREAALRNARASAEQALKLDPENAEAYMVRGMVAFYSYDATSAKADLERARALAPGSVDIINMEGDYLLSVGNLRGNERNKRQAMALDPLAFVHPLNLADDLIAQGRNEEAVVAANQSIDLGSGIYGYDRLVVANSRLKRVDATRVAAEKACELEPSFLHCQSSKVMVLIAEGKLQQAKIMLGDSAQQEQKSEAQMSDYTPNLFASLYLEVNDIDNATKWQKIALDNGDWFPTTMLTNTPNGAKLPEEISKDPEWLALWADPRLSDLMAVYRANLIAFRKGD
jgi:TolB-like protein/lipoprotein NlpI